MLRFVKREARCYVDFTPALHSCDITHRVTYGMGLKQRPAFDVQACAPQLRDPSLHGLRERTTGGQWVVSTCRWSMGGLDVRSSVGCVRVWGEFVRDLRDGIAGGQWVEIDV